MPVQKDQGKKTKLTSTKARFQRKKGDFLQICSPNMKQG